MQELRDAVNKMSADFDPQPYLGSCFKTKDAVIASVKKKVFDEFMVPLQEQIDGIQQLLGDKEAKLKEAEANLVELTSQQKAIEEQIAQFNA